MSCDYFRLANQDCNAVANILLPTMHSDEIRFLTSLSMNVIIAVEVWGLYPCFLPFLFLQIVWNISEETCHYHSLYYLLTNPKCYSSPWWTISKQIFCYSHPYLLRIRTTEEEMINFLNALLGKPIYQHPQVCETVDGRIYK